ILQARFNLFGSSYKALQGHLNHLHQQNRMYSLCHFPFDCVLNFSEPNVDFVVLMENKVKTTHVDKAITSILQRAINVAAKRWILQCLRYDIRIFWWNRLVCPSFYVDSALAGYSFLARTWL
ncbi:hypothetical protein MKW98_016321, partial [Papaver atlanticum]